MNRLYCDTETYSPIPLKQGTHRYAEQAEVMLFTWAYEDEPAQCWDRTTGAPMPADLRAHLADPDVMTVWANGGMFDRVVCKHALPEVYDMVPIERWYDTLVQALSHSLPGALDKLCDIFNVSEEDRKIDGKQLIRLFCIPPAKNLNRGRATRHTHPIEWEQFKTYAIQDIPSMRAVHKAMPGWNYRDEEMRLWHLDQVVNMRGLPVDVELAQAAIRAVDRAQRQLAARTVELTNGELQRATQRDALLRHLLAEYGVDLPDLQKSTLERRIGDDSLPWALRELLAIRLQASSSSTSKYKTLINGVSADGRLRGTLQFNGASRTGRWAGRLFQPQNLPSRGLMAQEDIDIGIDAMKADCEDLLFDNVMHLTQSAIRGCIRAPEGKKLVVADLSNIEGRVLAWLAGEQWKIKAFADFDAGTGHDLYKLAYAKSFGIKPEDVDKAQRQVGKVQELALGYEGGVGAFLTFGLAYNLDLEAMAEEAENNIPAHIWDEARGMLEWTKKKRRSTFGLSDRAFMVCDSFKRAWRYGHPAVTALWPDLAYAVRKAIDQPGITIDIADADFQREARASFDAKVYRRPKLLVRRDKTWLRIRLPSGRYLCYPSPEVDASGQISYMGVNQYSRKWSRIKTYGGKLSENITQAVSRDVMGANMPAIEAAGYQIITTVHDEIPTETPDLPEFSHEELAALMARNPSWAPGLPLAAAGFESYRYKKD